MLDLLGKEHKGIKNYKEFIERYQPILVIAGHFHENAGKKEVYKKTLLINPGPMGKIINLE